MGYCCQIAMTRAACDLRRASYNATMTRFGGASAVDNATNIYILVSLGGEFVSIRQKESWGEADSKAVSLSSVSPPLVSIVTVATQAEKIELKSILKRITLKQVVEHPTKLMNKRVFASTHFANDSPSDAERILKLSLVALIEMAEAPQPLGGSISGATVSGGSVTASAFSGVLPIGSGGTGTTTAPSYGKLLVGNASGTYDLLATSSLGISGGGSGSVGSGTQGQFACYNAAGTTLTATSSLFITQSGNVGIGTTTPSAALALQGKAGSTGALFDVASSTGSSLFNVSSSGNINIGNNSTLVFLDPAFK